MKNFMQKYSHAAIAAFVLACITTLVTFFVIPDSPLYSEDIMCSIAFSMAYLVDFSAFSFCVYVIRKDKGL